MRNDKRHAGRITVPVSEEALQAHALVPIARRLDWIEEMIRFKASLPKRIQKLHAEYRELARRPAR